MATAPMAGRPGGANQTGAPPFAHRSRYGSGSERGLQQALAPGLPAMRAAMWTARACCGGQLGALTGPATSAAAAADLQTGGLWVPASGHWATGPRGPRLAKTPGQPGRASDGWELPADPARCGRSSAAPFLGDAGERAGFAASCCAGLTSVAAVSTRNVDGKQRRRRQPLEAGAPSPCVAPGW